MNYVKSPLHYMGNKYKLLEYLVPIFPKQIDTFYDLFGGSGVVSGNITNANKVIYNELNENIYNIVKLFKEYDYVEIISKVKEYVNKYELGTSSIDVRKAKDESQVERFEKAFLKLREDYNKSEDRDIFMLYTLTFYSFSNLIRFNSDSEFNMPVGNQYFNRSNEIDIKKWCNAISKINIEYLNRDAFDIFKETTFTKDDFVYVDCPYTNTEAVYNEQRAFGGWGIEDDLKLFEELDKLTKQGIKWGLSNTFESRGILNEHLIEWASKNNYTVVHLDLKYYSLGKGNAENDEVYICNYNVPIIKRESLW